MKLSFDSLEITDFKCFAKTQVLDFNKFGCGLVFVKGKNEVEPRLGANGASKSSIFDALTWCLYGRTASGLKNPDIKPWGSNKTPIVTLKLRIDDQLHTITRTAKTNGLSIDGQEVGSEEAAKLIRINFDTFTNTVLLAQGLPLFYDRTPKDKMQLFSDVLQLERWEDRSAAASAKARELETLQAEMTGELTGLKAASAQALELFTKARQQQTAWEAERHQRAEAAEAQLKQQEALLAERRLLLDKADLAYDGVATELVAARKSLPKLAEKVALALKQHNDAKHQLDIQDREIARLTRELKTLGEADECPTCGQPIKGTNFGKHKAELTKQITTLERTALKLEVSLSKLAVSYGDAEDVYDRNNAAVELFEKKADEAHTHLDYLKPQVAELTAQVLALKSSQSEREEQTNPYTEQVSALRRKQAQLDVQRQELQDDLAKAARQLERTKFWVKGFKDVQLYVIAEVLEELQLVTNVMLSEVGLDGWRVDYALEKETKAGAIQRGLTVAILSPSNKQPVRYENWSGGEGQRLRIVGALALGQVLLGRAGVETNLEILDEPTRHLSTLGANDLCDYLGDRAKQLDKTIFFVDHLSRESSKFSGVVLVTKTADGSRIE